MTKKLLPVMIGAALAGGAVTASADVTVSGHIDEAILFWDTDLSVSGTVTTSGGSTTKGSLSLSADDANLECTTCSIAFSGDEDLGNGLSAIFQLDFEYDINERNKNITDRDQWVGLAGGFGKVRVGTISTVYKSHGAAIDPLYRTAAQARGIGLQSHYHLGAGEEGEGRATNTFRWDSPDFNGLKLGATYTLDSTEGDGEDNNPFGVGASYENGGIMVFGDYLTNDGDGTGTSSENEAWKVGGKFAMDNFSVFGQYEDINEDFGAPADWEETVWHIGGTYTMGSNTLYAAYGQYEVEVGPANFDGDVFSIVGVHSLSKSTLVYGGYVQNEGDGTASGLSLLDGNTVSGTADAEFSAFTVGMKHKF